MTVVVRCRDRPKLLLDLDTVCTITDMEYMVHHGTVSAEPGGGAYQEYYIRAARRSTRWAGLIWLKWFDLIWFWKIVVWIGLECYNIYY